MPSKEDRISRRAIRESRRRAGGQWVCSCWLCEGRAVGRWSKREALIIDEPTPTPADVMGTGIHDLGYFDAWDDPDSGVYWDDADTRDWIYDAPPVPSFTLADAI